MQKNIDGEFKKVRTSIKKFKDKTGKDLAEYAKLKNQIEAKIKTVEGTVDKMLTDHIKIQQTNQNL